jgi:hypothetical protein
MSLIHNERIKLRANALDRASTACLAVGVLGPTVAQFSPSIHLGPAEVRLLVGAALWISAAGVLHYLAHRVLGRLQ